MSEQGNAVDLVEDEDLRLRGLFAELNRVRGESAHDRADYEDLAKQVIRHLAAREAAVVDMPQRRALIDRVEKMSRGVQGINLNQGQNFDAELQSVMQVVGTEIEWELDDALPAIRGAIAGTDREAELKSAGHLARHASSNLVPGGPRWVERAPVVLRPITLYDRLRDYPHARHTR